MLLSSNKKSNYTRNDNSVIAGANKYLASRSPKKKVNNAAMLPKRQDMNMKKKDGDDEVVDEDDLNGRDENLFKSYEAKSN